MVVRPRDDVFGSARHARRFCRTDLVRFAELPSCSSVPSRLSMDLTGRVVLLTGVKRVGAVVAESLARAGADIALVYNRSSVESSASVEVVRALGRRAFAIQADLGIPADCQRV